MSSGKFEEFTAYRLALDLFDHVVADMDAYMQSLHLERMALAEEINRMLSSTIKSLERRIK